VIKIPDAPEWINTGKARREDELNKDLSETPNYPPLLQLTFSINTSPLDNKGRGVYNLKRCGGYEKKPRVVKSEVGTYNRNLCSICMRIRLL